MMIRMARSMLFLFLLVLAQPGCAAADQAAAAPPVEAQETQPAAEAAPTVVEPVIAARYPHDPEAFTQGLLWHDGALYESTGQRGFSDIRKVRLEDGEVLQRAAIPRQEFGEGLALWKDELISLTWQAGVAHRWTLDGLQPKGTFRYDGEGWGLTQDGTSLIFSDGTSILRFLNPADFSERRRMTVRMPNGRAVARLNELEYIDGALFANVWETPFILRIDPESGRVTHVIDCSALVAEIGATGSNAVLNGIAWDAEGRRLFTTGKLWPTLFEVTLPGVAASR